VAGIIVADTIQSGGDLIRLNSASQTVATINARGIYANTGNLLIAANGTIGVASITNTAITGTITQAQIGNAVTTTGPAFSATVENTQTISSGVYTKVTYQVENFDTNNNYDPTTNYRFTPTVAGYYHINWFFQLGAGNFTGYIIASLYKNGSKIKDDVFATVSGINTDPTAGQSALIYMNGTTDYLEVYAYHNAGSNRTLYGANIWAEFSGFLARAA